ncbi:MAG: hemolysin III family protein [Acidimicrobiales bacterium]|nr:hemolysin III family protein [Acidimicrobiales bacterium]
MNIVSEALDLPLWRGRAHAITFFAAIPAGLILVVLADGATARVAAAIYAATLLAGFGTSAAYHRLARTPRARQVMQRLDHSMIFLLITGTYVPICLLALPPEWGIPMLSVVGVVALVGIVLKLVAFHRIRWLGFALYPILGWSALAAAPVLVHHLSPIQLALIVAGGVMYTIGFPVLITKWPDPWPRTFGYHEVWHTFTIIAAVFHFSAVATLVV